ncbi:hypothetical protein [Insolitispirillum peregrinum]|uniref:hypothetical protein n=1 Tax=Insolitispirillum peregrinum TaxID=80876 RepID=UPI0036168986
MHSSVITSVHKRKRGRPKKGAILHVAIPDFTTCATIDTIIIAPTLPAPIHAATLHQRIIKGTGFLSVRVEPFGQITDCPTITLQDATPARLRSLAVLFDGLAVVVDRLDVALNCHPRIPADLDCLAVALARHHVPRQSLLQGRGAPRQAWGEGKERFAFLGHPDGFLAGLSPRWTTYAGQRGGPIMWRTYPKRMDHGQPIPEHLRVARIETELHREELVRRGLGTLADVLAFNYSALADLFKFAAPSAPAPSRIGWPCIDRARRQITAQRADAGMWAIPKSQRVALDRLNRAARRALDRLTGAFSDTSGVIFWTLAQSRK